LVARLIYIVSGTLRCGDENLEAIQALLFDIQELKLLLCAVTDCHFMVAYGVPNGEPIVQYGPFVD
tara:strand:+ start:4 stop:201 length:198 start_codon:yes stop_codon:yes gene_type:complete